uniref:Uncharacterized protein n=1 Tax=Eutreptiella gymnastica TaxID=73025 RepID=A0A6U7TBG0_9EUGL
MCFHNQALPDTISAKTQSQKCSLKSSFSSSFSASFSAFPINSTSMDCEDYKCTICLNMYYKPCMSSCGHVFCFWCIQLAMNGVGPSQCPLCRSPYQHFPSICVPLHHFILRAFPEESREREIEMTQEEMRIGVQSPSIAVPVANTTIEDTFKCVHCDKLAYEPMVPGCGHIFCKSCLMMVATRPSAVCTAPNCLVPIKAPSNICIVLQELLFAAVPESYAARAICVAPLLPEPTTNAAEAEVCSQKDVETFEPFSPIEFGAEQDPTYIHYGIICDGCGAYPVIGQRWRCRDCPEKIGFDICGDCHSRNVHTQVMTGKFNQTHRPDHEMELMEQVHDWLHQFKAMHPELSMDQLWSLLNEAVQHTNELSSRGEYTDTATTAMPSQLTEGNQAESGNTLWDPMDLVN